MNGCTYIVLLSVVTGTLLTGNVLDPDEQVSVKMADKQKTWRAEGACTKSGCFGLSYNDLEQIYSSIFLTRKMITQKLLSSNWRHHDYDLCCPTRMSYTYQTHMTNTNGDLRALVHLPFSTPPKYQFFPQAKCVSGGSCQGQCREERTAIHLLVFAMNSSWPFEFDMFDVPMYCSCKST